jgi:hypothetical protein
MAGNKKVRRQATTPMQRGHCERIVRNEWNSASIHVIACSDLLSQHIFFGILLLFGFLSFWVTHRSSSLHLNPLPPNRGGGLQAWMDSIGGGAEHDRALRTATDAMDLPRLRQTIFAAERAGHDTAVLRTAKFVHKHLSEYHSQQLNDLAQQAGHEPRPSATGNAAGGVGADQTKPPSIKINDNPIQPLKQPETGTDVTISLPEGKPLDFDWWQHPPPALAPHLPPFDVAAGLEKLVEEEAKTQQVSSAAELSNQRHCECRGVNEQWSSSYTILLLLLVSLALRCHPLPR